MPFSKRLPAAAQLAQNEPGSQQRDLAFQSEPDIMDETKLLTQEHHDTIRKLP